MVHEDREAACFFLLLLYNGKITFTHSKQSVNSCKNAMINIVKDYEAETRESGVRRTLNH